MNVLCDIAFAISCLFSYQIFIFNDDLIYILAQTNYFINMLAMLTISQMMIVVAFVLLRELGKLA